MTSGLWIIGYGSLIYKPPPHTAFKLEGYLKGFIRRFWQSSSDHRGTPESPGRVVTLISLDDLKQNDHFHSDLLCHELKDITGKNIDELSHDDLMVLGCAYYVPPEYADKVREYLDVREQDGYTLHKVPFYVTSTSVENDSIEYLNVLNNLFQDESGEKYLESDIYIGTIDNESFIGPEMLSSTAKIINHSKGPSGENSEYLFKLTHSIRQMNNGTRTDSYLDDLSLAVEQFRK